jgi:hypothetical protein
MPNATARKRANYFSDETGKEEYQRSFVSLLARVQKSAFAKYTRPENALRFLHGGEWKHPAAPDIEDAALNQHSSEAEVPFAKVVNHDLTIIDEVIGKLADDMERQFAQTVYSTVSAAAEKVGNSISAKAAGSPREAFAQMLEKVEFAADKFGNVALPQIHAAPETVKELQKMLIEAPSAFHERIEEIKARKTIEAQEREEQRKSRFVCYGEDR